MSGLTFSFINASNICLFVLVPVEESLVALLFRKVVGHSIACSKLLLSRLL